MYENKQKSLKKKDEKCVTVQNSYLVTEKAGEDDIYTDISQTCICPPNQPAHHNVEVQTSDTCIYA